MLLFFSISPGKRGVYILPALPMLALITAPYLTEVLAQKWLNRLIWSIIAIIAGVFVTAGLAGLLGLEALTELEAKLRTQPWGLCLAVGVLASFATIFSFKKAKFISWIIFIPGLWALYSTWGYRLRDPIKTPKAVIANIAQIIPADAELGIIGLKEQFLLFSPFKTTHFGYHTLQDLQFIKAWQWQAESENRYILAFKKAPLKCFDINKAIDLGWAHRRDWILYTKESRLATCKKPPEDVHTFTFQPK
ncbi:MAG: hypothetical protein GQ583_05280 [Methyloprofundus sp.]|nr:hypothetical protein [Methyloprofundus sp.]